MIVQETEAPQEIWQARLVDDASGREIPDHGLEIEPADLFPGNVLTIKDDGDKRHYLIKSVEGDPPDVARLIPAKSGLKKGLLLLVVLGLAWFAIRFAIQFITT